MSFSSLCGNPRSLRISIRGVRFHRPWVFFLFCSFFLSGRFPQENFAPGSPRNDDRSVGRPVTLPFFPFLGRPSACQSRSSPASDSPRPDDRARDCKTESSREDSSPPRTSARSPSDSRVARGGRTPAPSQNPTGERRGEHV